VISVPLTGDASVVFLSNEGLGPTIIESQVLSVARQLVEGGCKVTVVVFALSLARYQQALEAKSGLEERYGLSIHLLKGIRQIWPWSVSQNSRRLESYLKRIDCAVDLIHARTEYATAMAKRSERRTCVVWDCRGDTLSEHHFRWSLKPQIYRFLGALGAARIESWLGRARTADAALFVSEALRKHEIGNGYGGTSVVVPNFADPALFRYSEELRQKARQRLGIPVDAVVWIYVGSLAPWQGFEEMREVVERVAREKPDLMVLVVCDTVAKVETAFAPWFRSRLRVTTGQLSDVPGYLNAADAAFLLRAPGPASAVASPIKFAEYAMCGLPVIHNGAVDQVSEFSAQLGLSVEIEEFRESPYPTGLWCGSKREDLARKASSLLSSAQTGERIMAFHRGLLADRSHLVSASDEPA